MSPSGENISRASLFTCNENGFWPHTIYAGPAAGLWLSRRKTRLSNKAHILCQKHSLTVLSSNMFWIIQHAKKKLKLFAYAPRSNSNGPVVPNTRLVKDKAIDIFSRDATFGQKIQQERGEGTEFDALTEFQPGMDKRAIDWKHSCRAQ